MESAPPSRPLSPRAREELQTSLLRMRGQASAALLWERVLTIAERGLLGGDFEKAWGKHGTAGMWMKLHSVSLGRAVVEVANELNLMDDHTRRWLLRELGEVPDNPEEALEAAIASGDLVLVEQPRTAYWRSHLIAVDWEKRSALWNFFCEVCRHAKRGQGVDRLSFGNQAHRDIVAKQKARLLAEAEFPTELGDLIKPIGRGTQKLDLPAVRIRLFEVSLADSVRERTA